MIAFPPRDTIRFDLPVSTQRCTDDKSVLLQAVSPEGSGVLLRVRYRDSLVSDSYPIVLPSDLGKVPAAMVAVRYIVRETTRSFAMDTGTAHIRRDGTRISARIAGSGIENAIRTPTRIEYRDVPLRADTVTCGYEP